MNPGYAIAACLLTFTIGYSLPERNVVEEGAYCDAPPPTDCSNYAESMEEWIAKYEESEDRWLQCQRDLARSQNELNQDIMCHEGTCEEPPEQN